MNPERDDEMPAEFDMAGGVRGKYVERYHRWANKKMASITDATGTIEVLSVTSVGGSAQIAPPHAQVIYGPILQELKPVIALEDSVAVSNAF